jgi:hypothetical protein
MKSKFSLLFVIILIAASHIWQAYKPEIAKELKTYASKSVSTSLKNISIITFK